MRLYKRFKNSESIVRMKDKKSIFYKYKVGRHKSVSDEKFEIPKAAQYLLLYDVEDTVLKFIYELVDKFQQYDCGLISDEQKDTAGEILKIVKELQDNDGYRSDTVQGELRASLLYGKLGTLIQHLWI